MVEDRFLRGRRRVLVSCGAVDWFRQRALLELRWLLELKTLTGAAHFSHAQPAYKRDESSYHLADLGCHRVDAPCPTRREHATAKVGCLEAGHTPISQNILLDYRFSLLPYCI